MAILPSLLFVAFAHLYRVNNALDRAGAASALVTASLLGITLTIAIASDLLLVRRPPWPWARSLPTSSLARVLDDAVAIGATALLALFLVAREDWRTSLVVLAATALIVAHASGAVRRGRGRTSRASGEIALVGVLVTTVNALRPWMSLVALALVPVALLAAARADRRGAVTRWEEAHHGAAGDPLVASAR
jgi:hypothetical protein